MKTILKLTCGLLLAFILSTAVASEMNVNPFESETASISVLSIEKVLPVFLIVIVASLIMTVAFRLSGFNTKGMFGAYAATELLEARAFLEDAQAGKIQQNELRRPITGALNAYVASTPSLILGGSGTLESIKNSHEQVTKVPVLTKLTADNGTVRKCGTTGTGDSAMVTLSYQTLYEGFAMSELLHDNNIVAYQAALRHNFMEKFRILHQRLEVLLAAHLEANKSAVNNGSINNFDIPTSTMQVAFANRNQMFASIMTEMAENNFMPEFMNVHSMGQKMYQFLQQLEGAGNQNNLAPQQNGFIHHGSNLVTPPTGTENSSYIFVPGTVGIIGPWMNKLHRKGAVSGPDTWTTIPDPFIPGWVWELKIQTGCVDNSSVSVGREADLVTSFGISGEFAFVKAYTSNTDTGIYKYSLLS